MSLAVTPLTRTPQGGHAHADDRGTEILARVRTAFARKGFDGTSMQDLAREAGMSVGNFYRYFPSKTAIVEALVAQDIAEIQADFDRVLQAPDHMQALRIGLAEHLAATEIDDCRLWAEITAAAQRQSEVAATCCRMEDTVVNSLLKIFGRVTGLDAQECGDRFGAHARFIVLLVKSAAMRNDTSPDPALNALLLRSIDHLLCEVSDFTAKA